MDIKSSLDLFKSNSSFESTVERLLENGPSICKFLIFNLQKYENKMNTHAVVISKSEYIRIQTQFYYDIVSVFNAENEDDFLLRFNILNLFFSKYKDSAYSMDSIYRYDLPTKDFDIKEENAFDAIIYLLTELSDTTTRAQKLTTIDLNKVLDRNRIKLPSKVIKRIVNFYTGNI